MKVRSTVFWPEMSISANDVVSLDADQAKARIAEGFAVAVDDLPAVTEAAADAGEDDSDAAV